MDLNFWNDRWQMGETGFHQSVLNPYLAYCYGEKGPSADSRSSLKVFVPLCGKSQDMQWLSQNGYDVIGVECSSIAVKDFFEKNTTSFEITESDRYIKYTACAETSGKAKLEIIQGDFFELSAADIEGVTDVFDRASLIALPEAMRKSYVEKMAELLNPGVRILLITMTYPQHEMDGPPFSVDEEEVDGLYNKNFKIEKLLVKDILSAEQKFQQRGLTSLIETAYKLTRK